jgi:SAM-dependent methyltransferase
MAIDFGCGTGRSTRFLQGIGFDTTGVDISEEMIRKAKELDPKGDYRLITEGDCRALPQGAFNLVLSVFTFDNIPGKRHRIELLRGLRELLAGDGKIILLDSTPELYANQWASFSTKEFPANKSAQSGDRVHTIMLDVEDRRPVDDIIWFDDDYRTSFERARLELVDSYKPLGSEDEPYEWVNETRIAPWVVYIVRKAANSE